MFFFFNWILVKSLKIRSVVNTSSRYFNVLFYDIKHTSEVWYEVWYTTHEFSLLCVLKKCLNGTTEWSGTLNIIRQTAKVISTH